MKKLLMVFSLLIFSFSVYAYTYGPWQLVSMYPRTTGYLCEYQRAVYHPDGRFYKYEKRQHGAVRTGTISGAPVYQCFPPTN